MEKKIDLSKVKIVQIPVLEDEWRLWRTICEEEGCSPKLKVREMLLEYMKTKLSIKEGEKGDRGEEAVNIEA
jgi:hypothetical protein